MKFSIISNINIKRFLTININTFLKINLESWFYNGFTIKRRLD